MPDLPIGTVTFLFTDIAGSTRLWEQHHAVMSAALARHDAILRTAIESHGGVIFKTVGDGCHAVFGSAFDAVAAAVAAQRALSAEPWGMAVPLRVRAALHTGLAEAREGDYFGPPLNRAARLLSAAHGGQLLLSLVTAELVRDNLSPELTLRDLGVHRLRDLTRSEQIFQLVAPDLLADFPPLNTLDRRPHNLPAQPTTLIGREWEVTNICSQLRREDIRLLTLTGPGGAGKTRLAVQAAAELLDHFHAGVYFVALAPTSDPSRVMPAIAQALGIKETGPRSIVEQLEEYVSDKQMLLVLDNFEQVIDAALLVGELLAAGQYLKILITSRSPLRLSSEHEFAVPPLTLPDRIHPPAHERLGYYESVRLFVERAQAVRPDFTITEANAPAVVEICHRLDGLPLAIELAAAHSKLFPPIALLERLRGRPGDTPLQLLTAGARDLPPRQQTLRATIDWSYNLLPPHGQSLLTQLAIFVGGCTLDAIEVICAENSGQAQQDSNAPHDSGLERQAPSVIESVELLLDHKLLRQVEGSDSQPRLIMLETIRQYALERLSASAEELGLPQRHADYYLALAEVADSRLAGAEQGAWLPRLEIEHANIRAALEWYRNTDPERGLRLACALWRFWEMHSHLSEGRAWLREGLRASGSAPAALRARALHGAGVLAYLQGDYQEATAYLQEGLVLFNQLHDNIGAAHILRGLGLVAWFQGDQNAGRTQLEASVALFRNARHTWGTADALHYLGHVMLDRGDVAVAQAIFAESLDLFRATGDKRNIALPLKDFGLIASQQGDYTAARPLYEESLALSRAVDDTWHVADTLQRLGDLARLEGDYEQATQTYQECLELWQKLGNNGGIAEALNLLGEVAYLRHDYRRAKSFYTESLTLHRTLGSKRVIAAVLHNLGKVAQHEGDYERAAACYRESLALNDDIGYPPGIADCFIGLAAIAAASGLIERAAQLLGAAEPHLDTIRGFMPLTDRANYEETLALVRAQPAFTNTVALGRSLPLDQAIAYALEQPLPRSRNSPTPEATRATVTPAAYPAGLTEREVAVLRLVAQGLTDGQVAEQLVISRRTVNAHLRSIYSKLEVTSRTAAAHFAITNQLV